MENELIESDDEDDLNAEESENGTLEESFELNESSPETKSRRILSENLEPIEEANCKDSEESNEEEKSKHDDNEKDSHGKKNIFKSFTLRPYKQKRRISITKKFEKIKDNFTKKSISESVDETSEYLDSMDQKLDK